MIFDLKCPLEFEETLRGPPGPVSIPAQFLHDQLAAASPALLRSLLSTFIDALMSAEADAVCGATYGLPPRSAPMQRNSYRQRDFDTRAGMIDVAIPKLRQGSCFPDWLLEQRRRAEAALTSVVATCSLLGVSTRRRENSSPRWESPAVPFPGFGDGRRPRRAGRGVSHPAAGPYTFIAADALVLKVREAGSSGCTP